MMTGALAALSLWATPLAAQSVDASNTQGCELHVWPSQGLHSVYYGWVHGGINDGAVKGQNGYPKVDGAPLAIDQQHVLLADAHPERALDRSNYKLVIHTEALSSSDIRGATGRLSQSTSPCYAELIIEDVFFQQDVFSGSFLKTMVRFRDFGSATTPTRVFGTWVHTALAHVPANPGDAPQLAADDLQQAYRNNLSLFAEALNKPAKSARK